MLIIFPLLIIGSTFLLFVFFISWCDAPPDRDASYTRERIRRKEAKAEEKAKKEEEGSSSDFSDTEAENYPGFDFGITQPIDPPMLDEPCPEQHTDAAAESSENDVKDSEPDRTTTPSAEPPKSEEQSDTSSESSKNDENAQDSSESSSTTSSKSSKSDVSYHEDGEEGIQLEVISS